MERINTVLMGEFPKNVVDKEYNSPIYRCIHFERLLEMILDKKLVFVKTKKWEDTYENFLFKTKIKFGNNPTSLHQHIDSLYGQCWSMKKETDAIWRIYSPTKQSMIIKTRISKLKYAALNEEKIDNDPFDTFKSKIAPVKYISKRNVKKLIKEYSADISPDPYLAFNSLFIKRAEFRHEHEVRIIIQKKAQDENEYYKNGERTFIKFNIEPNDFIEEILLDPRIVDTQFKLYSNIFKSAGYLGRIRKSNLYENLE